MRSSAVLCAVGLVALGSAPVAAQTARSSAGDARGGDRRARARSSLGDRVPAGRPPAGHRAAGPHAHRRDRRQAVAGARRRAEGVRIGPGRPARRRARPRLRAEPHHLFLLRRTGQRRRPHDAGARAPGRRRHAAARRRQGDLPQDGPLSSSRHFGCRIVQSRRRQPVPEHGRPRQLPATRRRTSATTSARSSASGPTARCRPTIRSSAGRAPSPKSGATATATAQGLARHPMTGQLWEHEHGPRGGDEVNLVDKGKNYGWPVIGYGIDYSGAKIHESTQKAGMEQPLWHWVPSIAPSGMAFYTGDLFPAWRGNLFVGALAAQAAGAARARRPEGRQGGAPVARPERAHPRRPPGPGRRALARHRQLIGPDSAGRAGEVTAAQPQHGPATAVRGTRCHSPVKKPLYPLAPIR